MNAEILDTRQDQVVAHKPSLGVDDPTIPAQLRQGDVFLVSVAALNTDPQPRSDTQA